MGKKLTDQKLEFLRKLYSENNLPNTNLEKIEEYIGDRKQNELSDETTATDLKGLVELSKAISKPFTELTKKDIHNFFDLMKNHLAASTVTLYKVKLRIFFTYIGRGDLADLCISSQKNSKNKLPEDLLTVEEVEKLIDAATNLRDKAFIAFLYESGARRGEIFSIQIKHIQFDKDGAVVTIPKGKTGARRIRIVFSAGYLHNWLSIHPDKDNRDSSVWASLRYKGKAEEYNTAWSNLRKYAREAGIQKAVNLHNFRHARATHLAKNLTEQQLKNYLGWTAGSSMAAIYVHLSGKDMDETILEMYGIKPEEKKETSALKTIKCPRCKELQDSKAAFCFKCGLPLSTKAVTEEKAIESDITRFIQNPEFMAKLAEQLRLLNPQS